MNAVKPALIMTLLFTILTGVVFPIVIWALGQALFPFQAQGSFLKNADGSVVGSELIGQAFSSAKYFHPRPSAAGSGYDPTSSGGTNLGPTSSKLIRGIKDDPVTTRDESFSGVFDLVSAYRRENEIAPSVLLPADAVTRSASGLDPEISVKNAFLQANRIARARTISQDVVTKLITANIKPRFLGIFGEPRVNVLRLNLLLDQSS